MKETGKSQVTIMEPMQLSSMMNEQNSHSDSLLGASLLIGMLLIALAAGAVLGLRSLYRRLTVRESVPAGGTEPTNPSLLS